nr:L-2-amino-thiazoline-4-carboxylic acid hydrolase [Pseudomonas caspiana]
MPGNLKLLSDFRKAVCRYWRQALGQCSQRNRLQWSRFGLFTDHYIPSPKNAHPYPEDRFASRARGRSRNRDELFIVGYNPDIELTRTQTIMGGAPCCDFRYKAKPQHKTQESQA